MPDCKAGFWSDIGDALSALDVCLELSEPAPVEGVEEDDDPIDGELVGEPLGEEGVADEPELPLRPPVDGRTPAIESDSDLPDNEVAEPCPLDAADGDEAGLLAEALTESTALRAFDSTSSATDLTLSTAASCAAVATDLTRSNCSSPTSRASSFRRSLVAPINSFSRRVRGAEAASTAPTARPIAPNASGCSRTTES